MEAALSTPFLPSTILFSLLYDRYEKDLKKELFMCHKNMKLSMEELYVMPRRDRKFYILTHNKEVDKEKDTMKRRKK